jgi:hypothetical protein
MPAGSPSTIAMRGSASPIFSLLVNGHYMPAPQ